MRNFGLLLALCAGALAADPPTAETELGFSCSELGSCAACSNASAFCHFCESDGQCHALGSVYGCAVGMTCYSNAECVRGEAVFTGYDAVSSSTALGAFALGLVTLTCCLGLCGMVRVFLRPGDEAEGEYVQMKTFRRLSGSAEEVAVAEAEADAEAPAGGEPWDPVPARGPEEWRWRKACGACACLVLPPLLVVLVLFAPQYPVYDACNTEFEWGEFFDSLTDFTLEGKYEVLVSVQNPNRLGVTVMDAGKATFYLDGAQVATWEPGREWSVPAGSVADVLAVLDFTPSSAQALTLYNRYSAGTLVLTVDVDVDLKIDLFGTPMFNYNYADTGYELDLAEPGDRSLCVCPAW